MGIWYYLINKDGDLSKVESWNYMGETPIYQLARGSWIMIAKVLEITSTAARLDLG